MGKPPNCRAGPSHLNVQANAMREWKTFRRRTGALVRYEKVSRMRRIPFVCAFSPGYLTLTACGGAGSSSPLPAQAHTTSPSPSPTPAACTSPETQAAATPTPYPGQTARLTITLQTASGGAISSGTRSVRLNIAGDRIGPVAVPSGGNSVTVSAPLGQNEIINAVTYANAAGTGTPLAGRNGSGVTVLANQTNDLTLAVYDVPVKLTLGAQPSALSQGFWSAVALSPGGTDASGQSISGPFLDPALAPFTFAITSSDGEAVVNTTGDESPGQLSSLYYASNGPLVFDYAGVTSGPITLTVATSSTPAPCVTPGTAPLSVATGPSGNAQIFAGSTSSSQTGWLAEFPTGTSGNATPLRNLAVPAAGAPFGANDSGDFWAGSTHYDSAGNALGTLSIPGAGAGTSAVDSAQHFYTLPAGALEDCAYSGNVTIEEYPAGVYGSPAPIRDIQLGAVCNAGGLAVDGTGDVYVAESGSRVVAGNATILEFGPSGSGTLTPSRTMTVSAPPAMATDAAGNLYVLVSGALSEYAPASTTAQSLLPGVDVSSFAVDAKGDIFAEVSAGATFQLEEFPAGSSTPGTTISGSNTQFGAPGAITVAP
jgi:hypothetical protein